MVLNSSTGKLIQKRATTGSLTGVFHLCSSGMKEAKTAENIFLVGIGIPVFRRQQLVWQDSGIPLKTESGDTRMFSSLTRTIIDLIV
jgi:hypothetical protein